MQEGTIALAGAMEKMSQLSVVEIGVNFGSGVAGGVAMANVLIDKMHLSVLDFVGGEIGNEGAMALSTALKGKPELSILRLSGNDIGDEAMMILAETLTAAPALRIVDFLFNPINNETAAVVRDLLKQVPNLLVEASKTKGCPHLCPSGQLHDPDAMYPTGGSVSCLEQQEFCSASDENCDSCDTLHVNAMAYSDCCGPREACSLECGAGLAIDRHHTFQLPVHGKLTCGLVADFLPAGMFPMPCDEVCIYFNEIIPCCA
jgi:hypothetical protein